VRSRERRKKKGLEKCAARRHSREGGRVVQDAEILSDAWARLLYIIGTLKSPPAIMICILAVNASS